MLSKTDPRQTLLQQLEAYAKKWPSERAKIQRLTDFVIKHSDCFERTLLEGHVTGSGLVVSADFSKVLLTHHAKLGKWLQLGGHSDGHPFVHETALRECEEESGLSELKLFPLPPAIFDIDIHEIPERKTEPVHFHYDIRFLVVASREDFVVSEESHALRWFTHSEASKVTTEPSMLRQFEKLKAYQK